MDTLKRDSEDADYKFTPSGWTDSLNLQYLVVSGRLIDMFISYESRFPEIPIDFSSHEAYKKTWLYLIQYEIYSKLLSRSSNKKHKIEIKNEELEDLELDEGEELAKKQEVKVSAQRIWVSYCISVELKNQKILEEKK